MSRAARGIVLATLGVVLLAAALRIAVGSLSPVLDRIADDISLPSAIIGIIGAAPPVAFAVFGILTPLLTRRLSLEVLAVVALAVSAGGLLARAFVGDAAGVLLTTLVAFAAIGVGNVILPALVKKYFPLRVGVMTTVYVSSMSIATIVPSVLAVPIADAAGWRLSVGVWAAVAAVAIVPWLGMLIGARRAAPPVVEVETARTALLGRVLRVRITWALVAVMVVNSSAAYAMFAWMPLLLREQAGVDGATAGVMLGVFGGMGLPFSLVVPVVVARFRSIRTVTLAAIVPGLAGAAGMLWAPTAAPWLWVILLSMPTALFSLVLVTFGLRTRTHATTTALSSAVQSFGYALAALVPILIGVLHGSSGGWESSLWLLVVLFAIGIPAGFLVARPGTVEDAWERRHGPW